MRSFFFAINKFDNYYLILCYNKITVICGGDNLNIYDYQRPVGKIEDVIELRNEFIDIFDTKSKNEMAKFGLNYAKHILDITGFEVNDELISAFQAVQEWIDGKVNYHKARNISFYELYKFARESNDLVKTRFYKTMAQVSCIPHVKAHGLWASDFAITLINAMFPNNLDKVSEEREIQIKLLKEV